ncbi:Unknown protein [Striga hermonthica]|uniref:DDE Tnp4 domain-containing protein n=1 Tax=Striga hermonthica TaxID=68872 RepID=A0A9N7MGR7_STRHE|nr:Unknown protein [Striga hermonthica]
MSDVDDARNHNFDHEGSFDAVEDDLENSGDDTIDDCVESEDDMVDSADDDEGKVNFYVAQLDSVYEQLVTFRASTSLRRPRIARNPVASTPLTGMDWINELYMGPDNRFFAVLGVEKKGQQRLRLAAKRFRHSLETISNHVHMMVDALRMLAPQYIRPPNFNRVPPYIRNNPRVYPHFKDCIGAIDGTLIPAWVPQRRHGSYRCRKGILAQNVMVACDFECKFTFVLSGWEGSANDARIFQETLRDPAIDFPWAPPGKYYLVDSGYINVPGFLTPYKGERGLMPRYSVDCQKNIVLACCVLHNFIQRHQHSDNLPPSFYDLGYIPQRDTDNDNLPPSLHNDSIPQGDVDDDTSGWNPSLNVSQSVYREQCALRDTIASALWADQRNRRA